MLYGWSAQECLDMPVMRFYAMLNAGRELRYKQESRLLMELCDVAAISIGGAKYAEDIQKTYYYRSIGKPVPGKGKSILESGDSRTGEILMRMLNGGGA